MAYSPNSLVTGLLGYNLKKDFISDGLYYRETELYSYEVYSLPSTNSQTGYSEIESLIKSAFSSYSGDLTIKNLNEPAEFSFPNDHVRVGRFQVDIEIRKPILNLSVSQPEVNTSNYKGLDETFWGTYGTYFSDFSEDFGVEIGDNGNNTYSHAISFSLNSGDKSTASSIAQNIFSNDKNTSFGISYLVGTGALISDSGNYRNYFSETYDLFRNSYSFTKKREVLPLFDTNYTYNLGHIINLKEDGIIDVSEKGNIQGKYSFGDAQIGYGTLIPLAYSRCSDVYTTYKNFISSQTITSNLINLPLNSTRIFNKLNLSLDYELTFSNNSIINSQSGVAIEETIDLDKNENGIIGIRHNYNFNLITTPLVPNLDSTYGILILNAKNSSPTKISNYYQTSAFYDSNKPINRIRSNGFAGFKKKNLTASFEYTNNPTYFITINGVQYAIFDHSITDAKPVDIINEYKIINRAAKSSILNYAYQTEVGVKTVSLTAKLQRSSDNMIINPRSTISTNLLSLYKVAVSKVLDSLKGTNVLSLSYFLSDIKYTFNSDNDININLQIKYTMKKYKDI